MSKMPWFRLYSEVINDRKIDRVSRLLELPKSAILGAWVTILCLANESPMRGRLMLSDDIPMSEDEIAIDFDLDLDTTRRILDAFVNLNMIDEDNGYLITNWDMRQMKSDSSAERTRKYRQRKAKEAKVTVTSQKRHSDALEGDKNRVDKEKELEKKPVPQSFDAVSEMITALATVAKETLAPGFNEDKYESAAFTLIGFDAEPADVAGFADYWKGKGWHQDTPALKNILDHWRDYKKGRNLRKTRPAAAASAAKQVPDFDNRVGGAY